MTYKLQKQVLNGPMFAFHSFRSAIGDKTLWPRLRKHQLSITFPDNKYRCAICGQQFDESRNVDLHEYYSATYDAESGHFSVAISDLKFLCKDCHLVHHQSYVAAMFSDAAKEIQNKHIAKVNNISFSDAVNMPTIPVPPITIINGNPNDDFYKHYFSSVKSYSFTLDIDISDLDLKAKIQDRLNSAHLVKQSFAPFPVICFPAIATNKRTKSPYLANVEFIRSRRKHLGLSQSTLASICGVSVKAYRQWENGTIVPTEESFDKLATGLQVQKKYLKSKEKNPSY